MVHYPRLRGENPALQEGAIYFPHHGEGRPEERLIEPLVSDLLAPPSPDFRKRKSPL
jgi:hypothetical protein